MNRYLFIGGPWDGKRENCDGKAHIKIVVPNKFRHIGIPDLSIPNIAALNITEHTYRMMRFGDTEYEYDTYVHESVKDPMRLLLEGYRP